MKKLIVTVAVIALAGCVFTQQSPTKDMTAEQISHLSSERLCDLQAHSQFEPKLEVEIGKRDIQCTREFLACSRRGFTPKTAAFENCINLESVNTLATSVIDDVIKNTRY